MTLAKIKTLMQRRLSLASYCPLAVCAMFACNALADDDMFIPSSLTSSKSESSPAYPELDTLCNKGLAQRSEMIRSNEMSATHRALNYDWLSSYSENSRQYHGGRAAGRIAQQLLRQYWNHKRKQLGNNALLDENGDFKREYNGIDYDFSTSGGGLNVGFSYTFQ